MSPLLSQSTKFLLIDLLEEAMILESSVLSLRQPSPRTLDAFRNFFNNVHPTKEPYPMLGGHSARILDDTGDLVSLCQPLNEDRLTRFIRHYFAFILVVSFILISISKTPHLWWLTTEVSRNVGKERTWPISRREGCISLWPSLTSS